MIEQTTLHNILTWVIAVILFIFQSLNYFIARIKKYVRHEQKKTTVVTTDITTLSELNPNDNNAPKNVISVQGLIQKHFDIPLIIAEDEPKVNDFIKNGQLFISNDNCKEKQKINQFMEHFVDDSYVARGLGLITANVGRESEFYLYSKYDNNFENIVIRLKGRHGESGQITISSQNPTNLIETKSIPMDYFYDEDRIKVTYTPFAEGMYTLTLVRNDLSICRSPYYISVEKSPTNSRSQIRLGTKKYKMVSKFAKTKHIPLETSDSNIPVIEPSKSSISRNILPVSEENSIRTDVMSIVTKFESNSKHFQKKIHKRTSNILSKTSPKTDLIDEISTNSNIQPKIENGNNCDTNVNDLNSPSINSIPKSTEEKFWSNLNISSINSKTNDINSIDAKSNQIKKSIIKLDKSTRNTNDIPRVKNVSLNHLEYINNALLKESLNGENSHDVKKQNKTYDTNELIHGQNEIKTFLEPITIIDKSDIKCIDNGPYKQNEVSCFDDSNKKTVVVMENINELESHPKNYAIQQINDFAQYNINTPLASIITKITDCVCEKCSIKVLKILSEIPRDINIIHNNNSNEICSSFETLLAQPISININIDNLFENPIKPKNGQKSDNLLTKSPTSMKLMNIIDKDIKYHYLDEITPIDNTSNEIYRDINNTTTELIVKKNKHDDENKTKNNKLTNYFAIPLAEHDKDKHKTVQLENILSTNEIIKNEYSITNKANILNSHRLNNTTIYKLDDKIQMQVQDVQISSENTTDFIETTQFHEYINNELNNVDKENGKTLDMSDLVTTSYEKKPNKEPVKEEFKIKNDIVPDKNTSNSHNTNNTVLASMEVELPTLKYKDNQQEISDISNINIILTENQKLIIENSIEPVLNSFKKKIVEKITQLYFNKNFSNSENISINENYDKNLTHNFQKTKLCNNDDNKEIKTKFIETLKSQLKNHIDKNEISKIKLDKTKTDNNRLYTYFKNRIKTNMNPSAIHTEILGENNLQTLVNLAINHINNLQTDNKLKMIILENETPNFEVKKNNIDKIVRNPEIMLTKTQSGVKIETTTETVKSNKLQKTDVVLNINNKNKEESIKLQINEDKFKKIPNIIEKETINRNVKNNIMGTTINSTKNTAIKQIKEKENEFQEMIENIDISVEKENKNKLSQLNKNKEIITENPNSEVKISILNPNTVKVIKEKKISSESTSYNDTKQINIKKITIDKIENTVNTLGNNNESGIRLSHFKLAKDTSPTITKEFKKEKKDSYKTLNTKYKLKNLGSTVIKINCNINKKENKKPINTLPAEMVKLNINKQEKNETSVKNDAAHETEIILDKKINRSETDNSTLINSSITPFVKKIVIEFITKKNTTTLDSFAIILHEQNKQNDETRRNIKTQTNSWTDIRDKEVNITTGPKSSTNMSNIKLLEKLDGENVPSTVIESDKKTNDNKEEIETAFTIEISITAGKEKIEDLDIIENPLPFETSVTSIIESNLEEIIKETDLSPCTDITKISLIEKMDGENEPNTSIEVDKKTNDNIEENETSVPIDISVTSVHEKIEEMEITENSLPIETSDTSIMESNVEEIINKIDLSPCTDVSNMNSVEKKDGENVAHISIQPDKKINDNVEENETALLSDISVTSVEDKIEDLDITESPLPIETSDTSIMESNVVEHIKEAHSLPYADFTSINSVEKMDGENVTSTSIVSDKKINDNVEENETSVPIDISVTSVTENIEKIEITENPLLIESSDTSIMESNVEEIINKIDLSPCTNVSNMNSVEKKDGENVAHISIQPDKKINDNVEENETSVPIDISITSVEKKIEEVGIMEKPLPIETTDTSIMEAKVVEHINDTISSLCADVSNMNSVEKMDGENVAHISIKPDKKINDNVEENETSVPIDISVTSVEKKIEEVGIMENPLPIETSDTSIMESNVMEHIKEAHSLPYADFTSINSVEKMDGENVTSTSIVSNKKINDNVEENETALLSNISVTSVTENIEDIEITENPLIIESSDISIMESNVVEHIKEAHSLPYADFTSINSVEKMDGENVTSTSIVSDKKINDNVEENETSVPIDISVTSVEKKIEEVGIMENPLPIETSDTSIIRAKVVEHINYTISSLCADVSNMNSVEKMDGENVAHISIEPEKKINDNVEENETSVPIDKSVTSATENIEKIEITENPKPIETSDTSIMESNVVEHIKEAHSLPYADFTSINSVEKMDGENVTSTSMVSDKKINDNVEENETSVPIDISVTSATENIEKIEITENPKPIETSDTSIMESNVVEHIKEAHSLPYADFTSINSVEKMDGENVTSTSIVSDKKINDNVEENETSVPIDISVTSVEKKIEEVGIMENPLPIETSDTSIMEAKVVEHINDTISSLCADVSNMNSVEKMDGENVAHISIEPEKKINDNVEENETSVPIDISVTSATENIEKIEITENPKPIETSDTSIMESNVVEHIKEAHSLPYADFTSINSVEKMDGENVTSTSMVSDKKINDNVEENETSVPIDISVTSATENIEKIEITENPKPIETSDTSIMESNVVEHIKKAHSLPYADFTSINSVEKMDGENVTSTSIVSDKKINDNVEENVTSVPIDISVTSVEKKIEEVGIMENPLPIETADTSIMEAKVVEHINDTISSLCADVSNMNSVEKMDGENVAHISIEPDKKINDNVEENETSVPIDISVTSATENIEKIEITENPKPIETSDTSIMESNVVEHIKEAHSLPYADFTSINSVEKMDGENVSSTSIVSDKKINDNVEENETSVPIDISVTSVEKKIEEVGIMENPLPIETSDTSIMESNVVEHIKEAHSLPYADFTSINSVEKMDGENVTSTSIVSDKKINDNVEENVTSVPIDISVTSVEKKIEEVGITENPKPIETSDTSIMESNVVEHIKEAHSLPYADFTSINSVEKMDGENVTSTSIVSDKKINDNVEENETSVPIDISVTSVEQKIEEVGIMENPLPIETSDTSIMESNVVEHIKEAHSLPYADFTSINSVEKMDGENVTSTSIVSDKKINDNVEENVTSVPIDISVTSVEKKIEEVGIMENPLPIETADTSIMEAKVVEHINDTISSLCADVSNMNSVEKMDGENVAHISIEPDKKINDNVEENETSVPIDISVTSVTENIVKIEITENPKPIETSDTSIMESNVVKPINDTISSLCADVSNMNSVEKMDGENVAHISIEPDKKINDNVEENETSVPIDISVTSATENIEKIEITENPKPIETSDTSIMESNVVEHIKEAHSLPYADFTSINSVEKMDGENVSSTSIVSDKKINDNVEENETSVPIDISVTSVEKKIEEVGIMENPLPIETSDTSIMESNVVEHIKEAHSLPYADFTSINSVEKMDGENVTSTSIVSNKKINDNVEENETSVPIDISVTSATENIEKIEITENPKPIETSDTSIMESNVVEHIKEAHSLPYADFTSINSVEKMDGENVTSTSIVSDKKINDNVEENETSVPIDISVTSVEQKIEEVGIMENPLPIETSDTSIMESNVVEHIKEAHSLPYADFTSINSVEKMDGENVTSTSIVSDKKINDNVEENVTSVPIDISVTSVEKKIEEVGIMENPLPIETADTSIMEAKVVEHINDTISSLCADVSNMNSVEKMDGENVAHISIEPDKKINDNVEENETSVPIDISVTSVTENIVKIEITENPKPIETSDTSIMESNVVKPINDTISSLCADVSNMNSVEKMDGENVAHISIEPDKKINDNVEENETSVPIDISVTSATENIEKIEITENPKPIETSDTSIMESNVVEHIKEAHSLPYADFTSINSVEKMDGENVSSTSIVSDKKINDNVEENETSVPIDISVTSVEKKIEEVGIMENPLPIETSDTSIMESNVVEHIKEAHSLPYADFTSINSVEKMDGENVTSTSIVSNKKINDNVEENETSVPIDISVTSATENIEKIEITENPKPIETSDTSIMESNVVEHIKEAHSLPYADFTSINSVEKMDGENVTSTSIVSDKKINDNVEENETSVPIDISVTSVEQKIEEVGIMENPLPIETSDTSIMESNVVEHIKEAHSLPYADFTSINSVEKMDGENVTSTSIVSDKKINDNVEENVTSVPIDISVTSVEKKIEEVGIMENPLPFETADTSIMEAKVVEHINDTISSLCADVSNMNSVEKMDGENVAHISIEPDKKINDNVEENETSVPIDISVTSVTENIVKIEITENPKPIETSDTSIMESNVVKPINDTISSLCADVSNMNSVEKMDGENVAHISIEPDKKINDNVEENETSVPIDISVTSATENIEKIEITENPKPIETSDTSIMESNVVEHIKEAHSLPYADFTSINSVEKMDGENVSSTSIVSDKKINDNVEENETSVPIDISVTSVEKKIEEVGIMENPLPIETSDTSIMESNVVEHIKEAHSLPYADFTSINSVEKMDGENVTSTSIVSDKKINDNVEENETSVPIDISVTSVEKKIEEVGIMENPLPIETSDTSIMESNVVEHIKEAHSLPYADFTSINSVEKMDGENVTSTSMVSDKKINDSVENNETALLSNISVTSVTEYIEDIEITENPLIIESSDISIMELNVLELIKETHTSQCTDVSNMNSVEKMDGENVAHISIEPDKKINDNGEANETSVPIDISVTSVTENIEKIEITENPKPIESSDTSIMESNVEEIINKIDLSPCTNVSNMNSVEKKDGENVAHISIQPDKKINDNVEENETSVPIDISVTSVEKKIEEVGIMENPLPIETSDTSIMEAKVVEHINDTVSSLCADVSNMNSVEKMDGENVAHISIEPDKKINDNVEENETSVPIDISVTSVTENIEKIEITENPLLFETSDTSIMEANVVEIINEIDSSPCADVSNINSVEKMDGDNITNTSIVVEDLIETELIPCTNTTNVNIVYPIFVEDLFEINNPNCSLETVKLISNNVEDNEKGLLIDKSTSFVDEKKKVEETIETLVTLIEHPMIVDENQLNVADISHNKNTAHIPSTKIFLKNHSIIDFEIDNKTLLLNDSFSVSPDKYYDLENVIKQTVAENVKEIKNTIRVDTTKTYVDDQNLEDQVIVSENILTSDTSTASVQKQIQIEEIIKDESMILINSAVAFDKAFAVEQKEIKTAAMVSSITTMEEQTIVNADDIMDTFTVFSDKTTVEKGTHNEISSLTNTLVVVVEEQSDLDKVTNSETQILVDTSTKFLENRIKIDKFTEKEITALISTCASTSEVESNEIEIKSENKTSAEANLPSVTIEQTETDTVAEITSLNINVINSNTETNLIDKEIKTENSDNPKNCYLEFGETSKLHCLKNEDNLQGKSYGIQKLEMSVQRLKTSNDDYYEKTFVQLEQTEKISFVDKDKVDCENKNNIDDKLYTVNESDLNAILCASSLEEALTLLDSKIKFKFKHRKSSSKANSARSYIPEIQTSENRSSGTNTNFTYARDFFKEIEKKSKK